MRKTLLLLVLLALPAPLFAQQPVGDVAGDDAPAVQLEQSVPSDAALDQPAPDTELPAVEARTTPDEPAADQGQGPESREWWWLVGAIVAGGIILAILL